MAPPGHIYKFVTELSLLSTCARQHFRNCLRRICKNDDPEINIKACIKIHLALEFGYKTVQKNFNTELKLNEKM